ncbi:very-long-chain (3R)-3-hydroxyacyl-CoA dehydratase-like [Ostrinia furnacalis]|uniref:very-long-chain (3R)-3-hydroxyacyl-CoA dehydratase-like n=1 Tax=Ostrinia furnacalis TaxID=93504 RepID=UPI00103F2B7C|nr:very-long-chain (3R)-3-hydroxyacyl-CoA dehydratase-like [Ostrinia furnacalis]
MVIISSPSPFVYWAQTESSVSLRIDLKNVESPDFAVLEDKVKFSAIGVGAHGKCKYEFGLNLYSPIKTDTSNDEKPAVVRVLENRVDVVLQKRKPAWWPRLTAQPQKPAWLKINFDLWKSEDPQDSDEERRDIMKDYPGMYDRLQKEEMGYRREETIKVYLIFYNLFQVVGYAYILSVIATRYAKLGYASVPTTYEHVGNTMKFLQLILFLDIMHPLFGYTKGGAFMPFFQIIGRIITVFFNLEIEPRLQTKPAVFYLFITWSLIEMMRCLYYITQLYKKEIGIIKWLRYSLWVPLYPCGITCEFVLILRNIPYIEETKRLTVTMPNAWNFTFDMPFLMRGYLISLMGAGAILMRYMYHQRKRHLRSRVVIRKCK